MSISREQIEDGSMVERYVTNQLTAEERTAFEERLLWDHSLLDDVATAEQLGDALKASPPVVAGGAGPIQRPPYLAMAASAVLAAGVTLFASMQFQTVETTSGVSTGTVAYLDIPRSAAIDQLPVVEIGPASDWITLVAYPAFDGFTMLHVALERSVSDNMASWDTVWTTQTDPGDRDSLAVTVSRDLLADGVYRLRMEGTVAESVERLQAGIVRFRTEAGSNPP